MDNPTAVNAFESAQDLCAAAREQPAARPAFTETCSTCAGAGGHMSCGHWHACEADECQGTGVVVELPPTGVQVVLLGERLRRLVADDHTTVVPALTHEQHVDVAVAAALIEQLHVRAARADLADELEAALEQERVRVERLQTQLREALEGNAVLKGALEAEHKAREQHDAELAGIHDHGQQLSTENEELRSELGALKVEREAMRVAVDEATQAILDAGASLSQARAEAKLLGEKVQEAAGTIEQLQRALLERMAVQGVA